MFKVFRKQRRTERFHADRVDDRYRDYRYSGGHRHPAVYGLSRRGAMWPTLRSDAKNMHLAAASWCTSSPQPAAMTVANLVSSGYNQTADVTPSVNFLSAVPIILLQRPV